MQRHPHPPGALRPPCAALPPLTHLPSTPISPCSQRHAADGPALRTLRPPRLRPLRRAREASPRRGPGGQASRAALCTELRGLEVMRTGFWRANPCCQPLPACRVGDNMLRECCLPPGQPALLTLVAAACELLCCRAERSGGSFWSGFVVGGVVCGALGFIFAPQVNRVVGAGPFCAAVLAHADPAALMLVLLPSLVPVAALMPGLLAAFKLALLPITHSGGDSSPHAGAPCWRPGNILSCCWSRSPLTACCTSASKHALILTSPSGCLLPSSDLQGAAGR